MAQIVFVVGAGVGSEYGFPNGRKIKTEIEGYLRPNHVKEDQKILELIRAPESCNKSIDAISLIDKDLTNRFRDLIAKCLIERESLDQVQNQNTTYYLMLKYISQRILQGDEVAIINFNYDRSLREVLYRYNESNKNTEEKIDRGIITTVYGTLLSLWHEDPNATKAYNKYGFSQKTQDAVEKILVEESEVKFISELILDNQDGGTNGAVLRQITDSASEIYFLGAGYHEENMNLLGINNISAKTKLYGTGYGLDNSKKVFEKYRVHLTPTNITAHEFMKCLIG